MKEVNKIHQMDCIKGMQEMESESENHLECSNCEIGKSCCRECWHELYVPLAVNKKEDGLPPTDKSVGIRPTIL